MSLRLGDILIAGNSEGGGGNTSIDNLSITKNAINQLQTVGVINQSNSSSAIKVWTGTKAEYDLLTPDNNTIYNITDEYTSDDNRVRYNIGDIFYSMRTEDILNGAVVCDGSTYNISDYASGDQSVRNLLRDGKLPYVSLETYSTTITSKGVCRCFGYDAGGETFRVPTLSDVFIETGTPESANEKIDAGLPNITGYFNVTSQGRGSSSECYGSAFTSKGGTSAISSGSSGGYDCYQQLDASNSSSIYGNSDTVQPNAVKYRAYIQLATDTTDSALQTVSSVLNDVSTLQDQMEETLNYGNITNCITEIPQDIKLELNNGTLTLKAGSKVYVPNGNEVFTAVTLPADASFSVSGTASILTFVKADGTAYNAVASNCVSGSSQPSLTYWGFWYDTTNNIIKHYNGSSWDNGGWSLPLCLATVTSDSVSMINQIFNGFGYIGSTVFTLPGVKGLIPNGRNADGTLKNIELNYTNVMTCTRTDWGSGGVTNIRKMELNTNSISGTINVNIQYNKQTNYNYNSSSGQIKQTIFIGTLETVGNTITHLEKIEPFRALDYNDSSYISQCSMPSNKYIDLTPGEAGTNWTFIAPANGYFSVNIRVANAGNGLALNCNNVCFRCPASTTNQLCAGFVPCGKGDTVECWYNTLATTNPRAEFRFIYAEGEVN